MWHFDYAWEIVKIGFWLWAMSGFKRLPHHTEVLSYDPRWISDMQLAHQLYSHKKNSSPVMQMGEKLFKNGKRGLAALFGGKKE